jgi:hypothetical protein
VGRKKGLTTLYYSTFWAVFAAKSAVAQRSVVALTLQKFGAKKALLRYAFWAKSIAAQR